MLSRRQYLRLWAANLSGAPLEMLRQRWQRIETDGTLGAAALHLPSGQHVSLRGDQRFPLASVCKVPIAIAVLAMVDDGQLTRDESIEVVREDVTRDFTDIGRRWPNQRSFPLDELLLLMIAKSDNTAVETLYRIAGGAAAITARLNGWRLEGIRIDRTERQCGLDAAASMRRFIDDPRDTGTPEGTVQLLARLFRGELLSPASTERMIEMMQATTTGPHRIKERLPPGTVVAHKTGTAGTSHGLNGGTNDAGVITLPKDRGQLAVAVYLKGSRRPIAAREKVIAQVARAAFDYWQV